MVLIEPTQYGGDVLHGLAVTEHPESFRVQIIRHGEHWVALVRPLGGASGIQLNHETKNGAIRWVRAMWREHGPWS